MCGASANYSKIMAKRTHKHLDARFSAQVLQRARALAAKYTFVIEGDPELKYVGRTQEMPGVLADGPSIESCARATVFAVESAIASLLEAGEKPPVPAARERRTEQVNLRLTRSEKAMLAQESARRGFRGLADFVRAFVLEETRPRRAG